MALISVLRAVHIVASVLLAGAVAFDLLVLGRGDAGDAAARAALARWLRLLCRASVAVALLSWAGWLALVAIGMSGLPAAQALTWPVLGTVVTRTTFGHVWAARLALLAVLGAYALRPARGRSSQLDLLAAVLAAGLVVGLAWTSHASASRAPHLLADAVHLLTASLWVGMLPPLWFVVGAAARGAHPASLQLAADATRRFSAIGAVAVAALAATGVLNAWWLVATPGDLLTTRYGLLLLEKIALFAAMVALALVNRFVLTPRIDASPSSEALRRRALVQLRRNIVAETLLAAAVIAIVGVLGVTAPAMHESAPHDAPGMQDMPGM